MTIKLKAGASKPPSRMVSRSSALSVVGTFFESLNSSLRGVDSMVVGFHKLDCSVLLLHEILDGRGCLVVSDVECWFVSVGGEGLEHLLECFHNVTV